MAPTRVLVSSGVMTTAAKVLTVVIMTLSATSALARKVTTLLAVPPGQLATKQILQGSKYSEGAERLCCPRPSSCQAGTTYLDSPSLSPVAETAGMECLSECFAHS